MTIAVRVISFFIITVVAAFGLSRVIQADFLIRPIVEPNNSISISTSYPSPITQNTSRLSGTPLAAGQPYSPSITFGDLLAADASQAAYSDNYSSPSSFLSSDEEYKVTRTALIQQILSQLEESYREQTPDHSIQITNNNYQQTGNNEESTYNLQLTTYNPLPTEIPTPTLSPTFFPTVTPQLIISYPQPTTHNPQPKSSYTIALLGDSMVDTLGKDLYHLKTLLAQNFPAYSFTLYNYGQGATDMDSGLARLTETTTYLGEVKPPLLSYNVDILVVESFAYNHWSGEMYDLDRQWLTIAKIIDTVKEKSPETKIILASTIAPHSQKFGDGVLNWPKEMKWISSQIIRMYLQNMINFATSQGYPLADAYHPSLGSDGNGLLKYINAGDHLHPSGDGGWLFAQKIIDAIKQNKLIQ